LLGIGLLTVPAVAHDWSHAERVANALFAASYASRRSGRDGRLLALAGGAALGAAGYLGGRLAADHDGAEGDWSDVLAADDLAEDAPRLVEADGTAVMVVRHDGAVYALSDHCSHLGGPLHEGTVRDCTITCPWHESVFDLRDGALVHGPAAYPQPAWDARARAGRIEVRRR
jgi:nitrite reductase/ring-hydroxylating ferredoxin subunit